MLLWGRVRRVVVVVRVPVGHVVRIRVVEGNSGIMALVDMVCVHDMSVARIARG